MEICPVKDNIAYRIRKLRENKDYTQQNMADELGLSHSAYSKIERGQTDPSVGRLTEIAKILEVEVTFFFQDTSLINKIDDPNKTYGFASKKELEDLINTINKMKQEILNLKASLPTPPTKKKKV